MTKINLSDKVVNGDMVIYSNVLSNGILEQITKQCSILDFKIIPKHKVCKVKECKIPTNSDVDNLLFQMYSAVLVDSAKALGASFGISKDEGYNVLKYNSSEEYDLHVDSVNFHEHERILSLLFYPNDDYENGEISFPRQDLTHKPKAGDLLVFPSIWTHPHRTLPIKSGTKYTIATWCY